MTDARPPRCRPVPPSVAEAVHAPQPDGSEAALLSRLETALADLPPAERAAVVASHGYGEEFPPCALKVLGALNLLAREAA